VVRSQPPAGTERASTKVYDPAASFAERVAALPYLGLGISTEFGARHGGLDLFALRAARPELVRFLEVGCDLERGVDEDARRWVEEGGPTTYHFLDVNLEEGDDLDEAWVRDASALARSIGAAWMCGDAGLWHVGPRERGHGVLAPPVLEEASAREIARNVARLRRASGLEVLPENPPAHVYLGRMHLCDYFALVAEEGDAGMLLDVAHLAVYQRVKGFAPFERFERLPFERIVELHVAGGRPFEWQGARFVEDDHGTALLPETLELLEAVLERAPNVRALVFECERNPIEAVVPHFERLAAMLSVRGGGTVPGTFPPPSVPAAGFFHGYSDGGGKVPGTVPPPADPPLAVVRALQHTLFRMQADAAFATRILERDESARSSTGLRASEIAPLLALDPRALSADPDGRRRKQILGNVLSEYTLTHAWCQASGREEGFLERFLSSEDFHRAMRAEERLPLAFGEWIARASREAGDARLAAIGTLEHAMAQLRRASEREASPPPAHVQLSTRARLVALPSGTHALARELRSVLDDPSRASVLEHLVWHPDERETVLLHAAPRPSPHRLAELAVESLPPEIARLVAFLSTPRDAAALQRFALRHDARASDLATITEELLAEGVLSAGPGFVP
jgi:uncharacterized protein (UPF0276 family)